MDLTANCFCDIIRIFNSEVIMPIETIEQTSNNQKSEAVLAANQLCLMAGFGYAYAYRYTKNQHKFLKLHDPVLVRNYVQSIADLTSDLGEISQLLVGEYSAEQFAKTAVVMLEEAVEISRKFFESLPDISVGVLDFGYMTKAEAIEALDFRLEGKDNAHYLEQSIDQIETNMSDLLIVDAALMHIDEFVLELF
jgi:hypothetical protein